MLVASLITKRFAEQKPPYTADELSTTYRIHIRLTSQILFQLKRLEIINEVNYGSDDRVIHYQPAMDIHQLTVSYLLDKMDRDGSEDFKIDTARLFSPEWKALLKTREDMMRAGEHILLKDL